MHEVISQKFAHLSEQIEAKEVPFLFPRDVLEEKLKQVQFYLWQKDQLCQQHLAEMNEIFTLLIKA